MRNHRLGQIHCLLCQKSTDLYAHSGWNLDKMARFYVLRVGRVSWVLEEEFEAQHAGVGLELGPESDR